MTLVLDHLKMGKNYHVTEFDSFALQMINEQAVTNSENKSEIPNLDQVDASYNMDKKKIDAMFTSGWEEGAKIAIDLADTLEASLPAPKDLRRTLAYADHGDEVDIDKMYSGRFDNLFRTRKRKYRPTQTVVSIGMHLCTLWSSPENTMLSGAVGIALAKLLEKYGYRVELLSILTATGRIQKEQDDWYANRRGARPKQHKFVSIVRTKEAYAPLNAAEIAAVHHPATAHTLVKAAMARGDSLMSASCNCTDFASAFATQFAQKTGRRIDYCFDWIGYQDHAERELKKAVRAMRGTIFDNDICDEIEADLKASGTYGY